MLLALIVFWSLVGAIVGALVGAVAQSAGRAFGGWGVCGFVIFPIAPVDDRPAPPAAQRQEAPRSARTPPLGEAVIHEIKFEGYPADRSSGAALDVRC
jgi:hypothetical protein